MLRSLYLFSGLLLSPLLILQGLYTRHKASGLPEPHGDRTGTAGSGKEMSVLILGDSAGAGVGVEDQTEALSGQLVNNLSKFQKVNWQLHANSGDSTQDCLKYIKEFTKHHTLSFDHVLISLGVNDVTSRVSTETWLQQVSALVQELDSNFQPQRIFWSELPPMGKFIAMPQPLRWYVGQRRNQLAAALANWINTQDKVELLEFPDIFSEKNERIEDWIASDGFHPGKKVYALWGKIAAKRIMADN